MAEELFVREELGFLELRSYGDVQAEELFQIRERMAGILAETGFTKVLVDGSGRKSFPNMMTAFKMASELQKVGFPLTAKIALLSPPQLENFHEFMAEVATNRGIDVRLFNSRDEALAWLLEE